MVSISSSISLGKSDTFTKGELEKARKEDEEKDVKRVVEVKSFFRKLG
tara:strand:+ start:1597 stop:1740 length:144 start_codon:yes stop_codon:yes gene_type:complete